MRAIQIMYHNPSVLRKGRWAGERGRQLINAMREAGAEVTAIPALPPTPPTGSAPDPNRLVRFIPRSLRGPLVTARLIQRGTFNTLRWTWHLWRSLRSQKPDVILARYHEYELTPWLVARLLRRPLILEVHAPFGLEGILRGRRASRLAAWVDRLYWRKADRLWVHTPGLAELVRAQGAPADRVELIPFGVPDPEVAAGPGDEAPLVELVFAGSFYPWHGLAELLSAFSRARVEAPGMRLTLVGDGVTYNDAVLQAGAFDLRDSTTFTGWLDRPALYRQLERSHIGVAPYQSVAHAYFEPVKILDYQMVGLPVIASDVGHIEDMVGDGDGGVIVQPGDVEGLAAAIVKLATDPGLRRHLGEGSRRRSHDITRTAEAVLDLCHRVAVT